MVWWWCSATRPECKVRHRKSCHHIRRKLGSPQRQNGAALILMTFLTLPHTPPPLAHRHTLPAPHQLVLSASSLPWHLVESRLPKLITTAPPDITPRGFTAEIYRIFSSHFFLLSQVSLPSLNCWLGQTTAMPRREEVGITVRSFEVIRTPCSNTPGVYPPRSSIGKTTLSLLNMSPSLNY